MHTSPVSSLLFTIAATTSAQELCVSSISDPIVATLDDSALFSSCAIPEIGVQTRVSSLFDVLQFSTKDFLIFCKASGCLSPVRALMDSIPSNCLIQYHGSAHNLSREISTLYEDCVKSNNAVDQAANDDMSRYFLDI
ncbi:hypothetical protein P3T76_007391 [Phytophthora citrophthora]|uniref:Elicitin n=1 Tax=Phytophthora citrophthora TaxID=4793 RepID=A0AAD9GME6_9STRA|nr:hypothetical protein P3T76_007385 [Phytophthora citrophthora]KAK1941525.1 hypothetical protein P3T76_007391 [Phytophthora citrophthora]